MVGFLGFWAFRVVDFGIESEVGIESQRRVTFCRTTAHHKKCRVWGLAALLQICKLYLPVLYLWHTPIRPNLTRAQIM